MTGTWSSYWSGSTAAKAESKSEVKAAQHQQAVATLRQKLLSSEDGTLMAQQLVQGGELHNVEELTSDAFLKRWLVARNWNVEVTFKLMKQHAAWRVEMMPNGHIDMSSVAAQVAEHKVFVQGVDKQGRALVIVSVKDHIMAKRDMAELERFVCFCIDALVKLCDSKLNPQRKGLVLFDLTDAGMANMDVPALRMIISLLNTQYVERLSQLIFYNPPYIFWGLWAGLKGLLPDATREKVVMVDPTDPSLLRDAFLPEVLPVHYGGSGELLPVDQAMHKFGLLQPAPTTDIEQAASPPALGKLQLNDNDSVTVIANGSINVPKA